MGNYRNIGKIIGKNYKCKLILHKTKNHALFAFEAKMGNNPLPKLSKLTKYSPQKPNIITFSL